MVTHCSCCQCRFTPKPYFTAPSSTANPSPNPSQTPSSASGKPLRARTNLNADAWQAHKQRSQGYNNKNTSYARVATQSPSSVSRNAAKSSPIEVVTHGEAENGPPVVSEKDKVTMQKMFEEMFRGRIENNVIDMVLQDVNWNGELSYVLSLYLCGTTNFTHRTETHLNF